MNWKDAINASTKKTASRIEESVNGTKKTWIRYDDGSAYLMVSKDGKILFDESRPASREEINDFTDWTPN